MLNEKKCDCSNALFFTIFIISYELGETTKKSMLRINSNNLNSTSTNVNFKSMRC